MEKYDKLQQIIGPLVNDMLVKFIDENIEIKEDKTNFMFLSIINLLGNCVIASSKSENLASNFNAIAKSVAYSFDELLKQVESEGKEELH